MHKHSISSTALSLAEVEKILAVGSALSLSPASMDKIQKCRTYLDKKIEATNEPIYGINTGFGSLYNKNIPKY